jgi:zinc transporter 1/2/3
MKISEIIKAFSIIILFLSVFLLGIFPSKIIKLKANSQLLSMTKAFSGGLLISVGLVHLLPEANWHFHKYI